MILYKKVIYILVPFAEGRIIIMKKSLMECIWGLGTVCIISSCTENNKVVAEG